MNLLKTKESLKVMTARKILNHVLATQQKQDSDYNITHWQNVTKEEQEVKQQQSHM